MLMYHAGAPMARVYLDFLLPLPRIVRGNEYVLVMVGQFTRWVECIPLLFQMDGWVGMRACLGGWEGGYESFNFL